MRSTLLLALLAACVCAPAFAGDAASRPKAPKQPNLDKQREEAQRKARQAQAEKEREERQAERESAKEERDQRANGDSKEQAIKPGDTVTDEVKTAWIDLEMTKLALENKTARSNFTKIVLKAWKDSETEDARYAKEFTAAKEDSALLDIARKKHLENLKKIWDDADSELTKKKVLDDLQLKTFQEDSKALREQTATDKYEANEKAKSGKKQPKKPEGEGKPNAQD